MASRAPKAYRKPVGRWPYGATGRGEAAQHPQRLISRAGGQVHVTAVKYALMISLVAFLNRLVSELLADPRVASKVALLGLPY